MANKATKLLILILFVLILPMPAFARTAVETEHPASLTVECKYDGRLLEGVVFDIYRVADVEMTGDFSVTPDFAGYPVSLEQETSDGWRALAQTLAVYATRDGIPSVGQRVTDAGGNAFFADLEVGLYLVCGQRYQDGELIYDPEPFLAMLPCLDESENWIYEVIVLCKGEGVSITDIQVVKLWEDEGAEENRPAEITVQLLKDGTVYETVVLSTENNWRYTWTALETEFAWSVAEETVPEEYTLLITKEGTVFILTNTYSPDLTEVEVEKIWEDKGHEKERPSSIDVELLCDGTIYDTVTLKEANQWKHTWTGLKSGYEWKVREKYVPSQYRSETTQSGGKFIIVNTYDVKLPQTGQLWWPIPALICTGALFFVIGLLMEKRGNRDEAD